MVAGIEIRQDTKTEFFNSNDLLDAYNNKKGTARRIQKYLDNEATKRYMTALLQAEIDNNPNSGYSDPDIIAQKRGKHGGTWMHPYLFIDFAMWLSPEFKVTVIKWVYDNLIKLRIEAGDGFKEVNAAVFEATPNSPPHVYSNEAKMINKLVFGTPDSGQRNGATEDQLAALKALQRADARLIGEGLDYFARYEKLKDLKNYL